MYTNYSWIDLNHLFNGMSVFVSLLCRRWRRESTILKHSFELERLIRLILISLGPQRHTNWIANHTEKHARTGEVGCPPISPPGGNAFQLRIHRCYRLRNLARSRPILHNQTSGGASVTHARTPSRWWATPGATRVLTFIHAARGIT